MTEHATPDAAAIRAALDEIAGAAAFRGAQRALQMLRYVVEQTLAGRSAYIKEYAIGTDVLGRARDFDPRTDAIVRVEASRLRTRLEHYYATEGAHDEVVIRLPKGTYVPQIERRPVVSPAASAEAGGAAASSHTRRRTTAYAATIAALGAVAFAVGAWLTRDTRSAAIDPPLLRLAINLGPNEHLGTEPVNDFALSSDGSVLVFVAADDSGVTRLYARRLDRSEPIELPGTHGARAPFLSPDGRWVGFWAQGKLKKTLVSGASSPVALVDAPDVLGAAWGTNGEIVASLGAPPILWRIHEDGGAAEPLIDFSGDAIHPRWPQWLPGERGVLFTALFGSANRSIDVYSLETQTRTTLVRGGTYGRYLANGELAYVDRGTLFAAPLDLEELKLRSAPTPIVGPIAETAFGAAQYDVAANGTLVYRRASDELTAIAWIDRAGRETPLLDTPGNYRFPRLSPDGRRLAFALLEGSDYDIWVLDLASQSKTRVSAGAGDDGSPTWSPRDGTVLLHNSHGGPLVWQRIGGAMPATPLLPPVSVPWSFSPDGRRLAYNSLSSATNFDLWTVPVEVHGDLLSAGAPEPFHATPAIEGHPTFSPDGRWIAYTSDESGAWEVYVRAFPGGDRPARISPDGGRMPRWSYAAPEIVYRTDDRRVLIVRYEIVDGELVAGRPVEWPGARIADTGILPSFDLARDGEHLVALVPAAGETRAAARGELDVVVNFFSARRDVDRSAEYDER